MHSGAWNIVLPVIAKEPEKGLTDDEKEHLARLLKRVRDTRFDGNATHMARALGIGQSQVSQILKGKRTDRSAGIPVLKRIRAFTGCTLDELIGLPPLKPLIEESPPPPPVASAEELAYAIIRDAEQRRSTPPTEPPRLLPPKGPSDAPRPRRR